MQIQRNNRRAGFTLAELMVVIVIIGLLATLVVPNVMKKLFAANKTKAVADIVAISGAIEQYAIENAGRYPDSLEVLITPDENGFTFLSQETVPKDPWGFEYIYEPPSGGSQKFRVVSYGKDGAPGGEGDATDIDSIKIRNQEQ
ncbi:MAG: type II secretion system major pseudopilin GspG [Planctomycetota bacterium]